MLAMETVIERERSVRLSFFADAFRDSPMSSRALLSHVLQEGFPFLFLKGTQQIAEDAAQDALLSGYKNLGRFRGQAKLSTCLTTIVINAARMQLRRSGYLSLDQEHGRSLILGTVT
jgi:DNA-directed RNA polymerase specialized sigma24 family protein